MPDADSGYIVELLESRCMVLRRSRVLKDPMEIRIVSGKSRQK